MNQFSVELIRECNSGSKMAVDGIRDVMDDVTDEKLRRLLNSYIEKHEAYGEELHRIMAKEKIEPTEPKLMGKAMAKIMTEMKLMVNASPAKVADIMLDGCDMGIRSISRVQNSCWQADKEVFELSEELVKIEQFMANGLRRFLS